MIQNGPAAHPRGLTAQWVARTSRAMTVMGLEPYTP